MAAAASRNSSNIVVHACWWMSAVGVSTPSRSNSTASKRVGRGRDRRSHVRRTVRHRRGSGPDRSSLGWAHGPIPTALGHADRPGGRQLPHRPPPARRPRRPRPGRDQAPRRGRQRLARRARRRRRRWPAAIGAAARRVEAGELDDQFPIDVFQTGSGTSTNMNVNEVLATLASATLGDARCTPTTTSTPRSRRTTPCRRRSASPSPGCSSTRSTRPSRRWSPRSRDARRAVRRRRQGRAHPPDGRHAGDARPGGRRVGRAARPGAGAGRGPTSTSLGELPLGGTAVGTGINAPPGVRRRGHRRARRRDRAAAAAERQPDGPAGRPGRAGRGVGRAARHRRRADEDRQRHPPAGQRTVGRARPSCCCPSCRPARRSCRARSTRCCASR